MEQLRALLQAASPEQTLNYNEVTLSRLGPVLGFAVVRPAATPEMECDAKRVAIQLQRRHPSSTIMELDEKQGMFVALDLGKTPCPCGA
jgi:hypothetical protein